MKSILLSIKPKYVAAILNGEKTIEIRKKFPKDYVGWVYIYCTKNEKEIVFGRKQNIYLCDMRGKTDSGFDFMTLTDDEDSEKFVKDNLNGKVVARFWCDKVEEIKWHKDTAIDLDYYKVVNVIENEEILKASCLQLKELEDYLQIENAKNLPTTWGFTFNLGYAIHITKLEVFDKPKEMSEFKRCTEKVCIYSECHKYMHCLKSLTRAPQSYCFIEV